MKRWISEVRGPSAAPRHGRAAVSYTHLDVYKRQPIDPATGNIPEGITEQTRQSLSNVKAILEAAGLTMDNVVKTTVFLADMNDFAAMNAVYAEAFSAPFPARSAVAVRTLPKNVLVEIEVLAAK